MRALAITEWYTSRDLSGISMVNTLLSMLEELADLPEPELAVWLLPRTAAGDLTWPDGFFDRPYVEKALYAAETWWRTWCPGVGPDELDPLLPRRGKHLFDYVLMNKYMHGSTVKAAFYTPKSKWVWVPEIPLVTWYTETALDVRLPMLRDRTFQSMMAANALNGPVIVMNEYDREDFVGMLEPLVHPDELDRIRDRTHVVLPTGDFRAVDARLERYATERRARREAGDPPVVFHGGSFEPKRFLHKMLDLVDDLNARGIRCEALLLAQRIDATKKMFDTANRPWASIEMNVGHDEFVDRLGEGDVLWCATEYEGTGLAYMEAIRSGMLPVVLESTWMSTRLPDGYPLVARDWEALTSALELAVRHGPALWEEWGGRLTAALDPYAPRQVAAQFRRAMNEVMEPVRQRNLRSVMGVTPGWEQLARAAEEEDWDEVVDAKVVRRAMTKRSRTGVDFSWITQVTLRWMLMAVGYRDRCDRPGLSMVRDLEAVPIRRPG